MGMCKKLSEKHFHDEVHSPLAQHINEKESLRNREIPFH